MTDTSTLLSNIRGYAQKNFTPIIDEHSWNYLEEIILKQKPKHVLEIGSAIGRSTLSIANIINEWGGDLISCEISFPSYKMACHYQSLSKVCNYSIYFADYCKLSSNYFARPLDFVFIDGQKNEYLKYFLTLTSQTITVRDQEKQTYILTPLLAATHTLVFDDIIKFAAKVQPLIEYLGEKKRAYEIVQTTGDDGFLVIYK